MNNEMQRLHEARLRAWNEIRAISDAAAAEARDFTAEDEAAWAKGNADIEAIDSRLGVLLDAEKRTADIEAALAKYGPVEAPAAPAIERTPTDELRAVAAGQSRSFTAAFSPEISTRALSKGTSTAGGSTVPTSFADQLFEHMIESSAILQAGAHIWNTTNGETFDVPVTTSHGTAALVAEGGTDSGNDPAFTKRSLGAYKYMKTVTVSNELLNDTGVDIVSYIARAAGLVVGNALGTDLITGNASSKPSGIVQTASTGVTGGTSVSGAFTADNLIDLYFSVIGPYRNSPSCAWIMRDATLGAVRKLKDSQNQYLWQPSLIVGAPDTLLGKPVYTDPNVAAVATSAKSVIFGDISAYHVRLAGGVRFERSDDVAFSTDQAAFRCVVRGDGILADQTGAVKVFVGGAS